MGNPGIYATGTLNTVPLGTLGYAPGDLRNRHRSTPSLFEPSGKPRGTYATGTFERRLSTSKPRGTYAIGTVERCLSTSNLRVTYVIGTT